jgi:hypothetical protein
VRRRVDWGVSIRHLATALCLHHNPRRLYFAVASTYIGFFDASGKENDPLVMYVSGFISTEQKWRKFEAQWKALLTRYGISGPFHCAKYVAGNGLEYRQFRDDPTRDAFEARAIAIIKRNTLKPFSMGLVLPDYWKTVATYKLPQAEERPYSFCALQGLYRIITWMGKRDRSRRSRLSPRLRPGMFHLVYEDGDDGQDLFSNAVHAEIGLRPNFLPKTACVPFQAADILAWRHARLMKDLRRVEAGGERPRREFFDGLFDQLPHTDTCGYSDEPKLSEYCEAQGYERRAPKCRR